MGDGISRVDLTAQRWGLISAGPFRYTHSPGNELGVSSAARLVWLWPGSTGKHAKCPARLAQLLQTSLAYCACTV